MQGLRIVSATGSAPSAEEIEFAHRVANTHKEMRFGVIRMDDPVSGAVVEYHASKRLAISASLPANLLSGLASLSARNTAHEVGIVFASREDAIHPASNNASCVFTTDGTLLASVDILTSPIRNVFEDMPQANLSKTSTESALWEGQNTWPLWEVSGGLIPAGNISFTVPENAIYPVSANREYRLGKSDAFVNATKTGTLRPELDQIIRTQYFVVGLVASDWSHTYSGIIDESDSRSYEEYEYSITIEHGGNSEVFTGTLRFTQRAIAGKSYGDGGFEFVNGISQIQFTNFPIDLIERIPFVHGLSPLRVAVDDILDKRIFHNGNFGIINGNCTIAPKWQPEEQIYDHGGVARTGPPYVVVMGDETEILPYPMTDFSGLTFSEPAFFKSFFGQFVNVNPHQILTFLIGYGSNDTEFGMFPRSDDFENITKVHVYGVARWAFVSDQFQLVGWLDPVHSSFAWHAEYGTPNCVFSKIAGSAGGLLAALSSYPLDLLKYEHSPPDFYELLREIIFALTGREKPSGTPPP